MDKPAAMIQEPLKALVVDEYPYRRELLAKILQRRGYEVSTAVDGPEGVELFRKHACDLIVLDTEMPRMSGMVALTHFRALDAHVGIVAMETLGNKEVRDEAERLGASLVDEPSNLYNLIAILKQLEDERTLRKKQLQAMSERAQAALQCGEWDRRGYFRVYVDIKAQMKAISNGGDSWRCQIRDISVGGCRQQLDGKGPFPVGVEVELSFTPDASAELLRLPASIVWTDLSTGRCGVRFRHLSGDQQIMVENMVAEAL